MKNEREKDLQELFTTYYPALKSFGERLVGSPETSEDIVQDVFLRLWEKPAALEEAKANPTYLYQMVKNKAIDYLRREKIKEKIWFTKNNQNTESARNKSKSKKSS